MDVQTVRRWIQSGKLRAFKPGKEYRVRETDLEEFLAAREVRPKGPAPSPLEPSFNDVLEEERRPSLQGLIELAGRLADRWSGEIKEREEEWRAASPAIRKNVKLGPNLHWAVEIRDTYADMHEASLEGFEAAVQAGAHDEAWQLYRALRRLGEVVRQTDPWFSSTEGAHPPAEVIDFTERLALMKRRIGARAS